jgi:hypothetical protein
VKILWSRDGYDGRFYVNIHVVLFENIRMHMVSVEGLQTFQEKNGNIFVEVFRSSFSGKQMFLCYNM